MAPHLVTPQKRSNPRAALRRTLSGLPTATATAAAAAVAAAALSMPGQAARS